MAAPLTDKKLTDAHVAQRLKTAYRELNAAVFLRRLTRAAPGRRAVR